MGTPLPATRHEKRVHRMGAPERTAKNLTVHVGYSVVRPNQTGSTCLLDRIRAAENRLGAVCKQRKECRKP